MVPEMGSGHRAGGADLASGVDTAGTVARIDLRLPHHPASVPEIRHHASSTFAQSLRTSGQPEYRCWVSASPHTHAPHLAPRPSSLLPANSVPVAAS